MKNNIGDLVANSMLNVLNSKEHLSLFNKNYTTLTKSASGCGTCGMDISKVDDHKCGDMSYTDDSQDSSYTSDEVEQGDSLDLMEGEENHSSRMDDDLMMSDDNWSLDHDEMMSTAAYSAIKDLLTASAALDAANYGKASELVVKLAHLVSRAAKKDKALSTKKTVKNQGSKKTVKNKKIQNSAKSAPSSKSNNKNEASSSKKNVTPSSKANSSKEKANEGAKDKEMSNMSMKEKMEMLRKMKK